MAVAYIPPGVSVTEVSTTTLNPQLATPGTVCLVGPASGAITVTEQIVLNDTQATTLQKVPKTNPPSTMSTGAIAVVTDVINNAAGPYLATTDYTFSNTNFTLTRVIATAQTLGALASAGAVTITLSAGGVPSAGQTLRIGTFGTPPTETAVVKSVAGQVVTLTVPLQNGYSNGARVTWGNIPDGNTIAVTYSYTPVDYFYPTRLNNMGDVQQRYGTAWSADGTQVSSPLSFAAGMAFAGGATDVVLQPLFWLNNGSLMDPLSNPPVAPSNSQIINPTTWQVVYSNMLQLEDISLVVPVIGQQGTTVTDGTVANINDGVMLAIEGVTNQFVYNMRQGPGIYVIAVMGEDATGSTIAAPLAQEGTLQAHAQNLAAQSNGIASQCVLLNCANFIVPAYNTTLNLGGQYVAAGVGGMLAGGGPNANLTRQIVPGLLGINDIRTAQGKNQDAASGLMVLESKSNLVQIRHATTCDTSSVVTRELNVIVSKGYVIASIKQTLDTQVIGQLPADANAPTLVNNVIIGTLEDLRGLGVIIDYGNVQSQITTFNPTVMAVQFAYIPPFIINYVQITFSLDLTNQAITVSNNPTQ